MCDSEKHLHMHCISEQKAFLVQGAQSSTGLAL
jgi:hypothetical protein